MYAAAYLSKTTICSGSMCVIIDGNYSGHSDKILYT